MAYRKRMLRERIKRRKETRDERNARLVFKSSRALLFFIVFHIPYSLLFIKEIVSLHSLHATKRVRTHSISHKIQTWKKVGRWEKEKVPFPILHERGMSSSPRLSNLCAPVRRPSSFPRHSRVSKSTLLRVSKILLELHELQKFPAQLLKWHFTIKFRSTNIQCLNKRYDRVSKC